MQVTVNGISIETTGCTIADLAEQLHLPATGCAVAANGCLVPRDRWADTRLSPSMALVVVKAAAGG